MRTVTKVPTRTFVIIRHMCHICIYVLVTVTLAVVAFTITFSLKCTYFCRFPLSLGDFGYFRIRWSSDPHLKSFRGVRFVCWLSKWLAAQAFFFSYLILLNSFSAEWLVLQKSALYLKRVCSCTISSKTWASVHI